MPIDPKEFDDITSRILGGAIEVHRSVGPGLLESVYSTCMQIELEARKLRYVVQAPVALVFKSVRIEGCYRVDLIVEDLVVVEIKCVAAILPVHVAQAMTYMRLTDCPAGLIVNFNVPRMMDGVKRLINPRSAKAGGYPGFDGPGRPAARLATPNET